MRRSSDHGSPLCSASRWWRIIHPGILILALVLTVEAERLRGRIGLVQDSN